MNLWKSENGTSLSDANAFLDLFSSEYFKPKNIFNERGHDFFSPPQQGWFVTGC